MPGTAPGRRSPVDVRGIAPPRFTLRMPLSADRESPPYFRRLQSFFSPWSVVICIVAPSSVMP